MITFSLPFPQILLVIFLGMLFLTTVYSFFLIYHWRAYGENIRVVGQTIAVYLIGVVCVFVGMASAVGMAF